MSTCFNPFEDFGKDSNAMKQERNVCRVSDISCNLWILGSFCSKIKMNDLNSGKTEIKKLDTN